MTSPLQTTMFNGVENFYNGVTSSSLRANHGDSPGLLRTMVTGTSRRIFTWSGWVKRTGIQTNTETFMQVNPNNNDTGATMFGFRDKDDTDGPNIQFTHYNGSSYDFRIETTAKLRDVSSWYHILLRVDTTQGTNSNRIRIYINGDLQTSLAQNTYPSENFDTNYNVNSSKMYVAGGAAANAGGGNVYFDSYITEINYVDGLSLGPDSFGETKNGVWIPINPVVSDYGNNGFRLQFQNSGTGTTSEATTATTNIGDDSSGNGHNFSVLNYVTSDVVLDHPENNFCVLGGAQTRRYGQSYSSTMSEGNLKAASGGNASHNFGTMAINQVCANGGVYFEIRNVSIDGNRNYGGVIGDNGVNNKNSDANGASYSFPIKGLIGLMASPRGYFNTATDASGSLDLTANANFVDGDVIGFAIKSDGKFFVHRNGTYLNNADGNTGNPSTGANPIATIDLTEGDWVPYCGYNSTLHANFGQDGSFAGTETSGGNSDANGFGDFMFAVPTGYLAMCSANMVKPAIGPDSGSQADNYFDITLYTGNGGDKTISGFNFQPDWVWSKGRSVAHNHHIHDSSRGVEQRLSINTTDQEASDGALKTFTSDGYTFDTAGAANTNNETYVNWVWHANAGTTTTNDASSTGVGTIDSVYQVNTKAGFSIVLYTGTGSAGTIAHGLGAVPKWYFIRRRSNTGHMEVYHAENTSAPATEHLRLSANSGTEDDAQYFNDTDPTSTVFSIGDHVNVNASSNTYVAYVFAEVEGYSKFGIYTGNGNADGPFVHTGFKPAWVMIKNTTRGADWRINDTTRQTINKSADTSGGFLLAASSNSAEITNEYDIDFLSNGFKLRSGDVYENGNGEAHIYMAFAEAPFKYSNAH